MVPGFSGQKMLLKSNLSLASRSYTKMETEPEKECSTGGWWRWPWPPCPAPPLFALWVRPTSSPSWQSERGSAQPLGLPIVPGCQFMIQYKLQQRGSGNTVKLLSGKSPPMSKSLFSCLSGFNKHRLSLNLIGVKGTNCRSWSYVLELNAASLFPRSPASVWISCCPPPAWVILSAGTLIAHNGKSQLLFSATMDNFKEIERGDSRQYVNIFEPD